MSKDDLTLKNLFVTTNSDREMPKLREAVARHSKVIKWDAVQDVLADKVVEMLDVPVLGILLSAWKKYREVKEGADTEGASGKKITLAQHTLKSEHHPYLEVRVKGVPVGRLDFTITLELVLEGFILTVQDRKITAVQTGRVKGQGSLALATTVIVEKEFGTIQLPGKFKLGEGIPLE